MSNKLLQVGLLRLQERFKALLPGVRIQCLLSESPILGDKSRGLPPAFSISDAYTSYHTYRESAAIRDEAGFPVFSDKPTLDIHGKAMANSAGEFYAFDRGASRVLKLVGPPTSDEDFLRIASDAGHLLAAIPPDAFPVRIPRETLETDNTRERWFYFLFDLAWAKIPGSPLRTSLEKSAWHGHSTIPITALAKAMASNRELEKSLAAEFPDPLRWYSVIDDMVRASIDAIDILLTLRPQRASATETEKGEIMSRYADLTDKTIRCLNAALYLGYDLPPDPAKVLAERVLELQQQLIRLENQDEVNSRDFAGLYPLPPVPVFGITSESHHGIAIGLAKWVCMDVLSAAYCGTDDVRLERIPADKPDLAERIEENWQAVSEALRRIPVAKVNLAEIHTDLADESVRAERAAGVAPKPSPQIAAAVYLIADIMATAPTDAVGHRIMALEALVKELVRKGIPTLTARDAISWAGRKDVLRRASRADEYPEILQDTITLGQIGNGEYVDYLGEPPSNLADLFGPSGAGKTAEGSSRWALHHDLLHAAIPSDGELLENEPRCLLQSAGAVYNVRYDGELGSILASLAGARYIFEMLQHPHEFYKATELRGAIESTDSGKTDEAESQEALAKCNQELKQIDADIQDAKPDENEAEKAELAEKREGVLAEVRRLTGLGGKPRRKSRGDSARVSVANSIDLVIRKCREEYGLPKLAAHLEEAIEKGAQCAYRPAHPAPDWQF